MRMSACQKRLCLNKLCSCKVLGWFPPTRQGCSRSRLTDRRPPRGSVSSQQVTIMNIAVLAPLLARILAPMLQRGSAGLPCPGRRPIGSVCVEGLSEVVGCHLQMGFLRCFSSLRCRAGRRRGLTTLNIGLIARVRVGGAAPAHRLVGRAAIERASARELRPPIKSRSTPYHYA